MIYIPSRGSGKTCLLILRAVTSGATVLVGNRRCADHIFNTARRMGVAPPPILIRKPSPKPPPYDYTYILIDEHSQPPI